jgi:hypothetical protein
VYSRAELAAQKRRAKRDDTQPQLDLDADDDG